MSEVIEAKSTYQRTFASQGFDQVLNQFSLALTRKSNFGKDPKIVSSTDFRSTTKKCPLAWAAGGQMHRLEGLSLTDAR